MTGAASTSSALDDSAASASTAVDDSVAYCCVERYQRLLCVTT
jgi:hypothetical protein